MEQDRLISRAKMAREQQRFNPDLVILADVSAETSHISKPLLERIKYFEGLGKPKAYSRYLRETIRPCLERLERVRTSQVSASFRFMASHDGLEGLLVLPEMNQDQVKRLSTLVAAHMSMCLDAACGELFSDEDVTPEEIRRSWERVAAEAMRLDVIPPAFEQLRRKSTAVTRSHTNLFRVRLPVCSVLTGGIASCGRCGVNGGKNSCAPSAWLTKGVPVCQL